MESGRNWSGNERNVAFLNTRDGRFAGVSALLGFDSPADGRGMVLVDWDGDGDQDIWMTQRTEPRLRFLRNDNHSKGNAIHIKLKAPKASGHTVGARVLLTDSEGTKQVRTLRAGEGYLSQFASSLHFGIGNSQKAENLKIYWPDGSESHFDEISKGHWLVEKGNATLQPLIRNSPQVAIKYLDEPIKSSDQARRLIPHSPLRLPAIPILETNGKTTNIKLNGNHKLLVFWATWCTPCVQELNELNRHRQSLKGKGIEILALNLDDLQLPVDKRISKVRKMFRRYDWDLPSALAARNTLELADATREVILGRQWTWSIPCSMLLNDEGDLIAIYEGSPSVKQIENDAQNLFKTGMDRDHTVPFKGQWYLAQYPPDRIALGEVLLEKKMFRSLEDYFEKLRTVQLVQPEKAAFITSKAGMEIATKNASLGIQLLGHAAFFEPSNSEHLYARGVLKQSSKQYEEAINDYEMIVNKEPNHIRAKAALAWLLSVSPDESTRNPVKALRLAEEACQLTQNQAPEALDVLAAAYAANGNFTAAVKNANRALSLLPIESRQNSPMNTRIKLFKNSKAYILSR